jgi:hypothetical protein
MLLGKKNGVKGAKYYGQDENVFCFALNLTAGYNLTTLLNSVSYIYFISMASTMPILFEKGQGIKSKKKGRKSE